MAQKTKKSITKPKKDSFASGVVHIKSTFNNTIVTITNLAGDTISWASAGSSGFKGARKSTPFAAQTAAEKAAVEAFNSGMKTVDIIYQFEVKELEQMLVHDEAQKKLLLVKKNNLKLVL